MSVIQPPLPARISPVPGIRIQQSLAQHNNVAHHQTGPAAPHAPESLLPSLRPSTSQTQSTGYLFPHLDDENNRAHFRRVQAQLLKNMDQQVLEIENQLREKENILKSISEAKTETGEELYKALKEIGKLNEAMANVRSVLDKTESHRKILETDRDTVVRDANALSMEKKLLEATIKKTKSKLEESTNSISHLTTINSAYNSDLKIQKRIQNKIARDLDNLESSKKQLESELDLEKKKSERIHKSSKDLEQVLAAQRHETAIAQASMNKMNIEIASLSESKKQIEKQWEEAVSAMTKRDETFQSVQETVENLKSRLLQAENENTVLKKEKQESEKKLANKEFECQNLTNQLSTMRANFNSLDSKARDTKNQLVEAQVAESLYRQELEKVNKHHTLAKDELDRKTLNISDMKDKLENMKNEFDRKWKDETIRITAKKEEQAIAKVSGEVKNITREQEDRNVSLRRVNAEMKMFIAEQDQKMKDVTDERNTLKRKFEETNNHYVNLYEEAKHLVYALERKEHDVNFLKSKLQDLKDRSRPYEMSILKLQKELIASKNENDRLQNLWLESVKDLLKFKNELTSISSENTYLKTQIGITDTVKSKTNAEIGFAKAEAIDHKIEAAKLHNELKKIQPAMEELKQRNQYLETQLNETRSQLEETDIDKNTSNNMLKLEIRRLYDDRRDVRQARLTDERNACVLERKYIIGREKVEKLKGEKLELQKQNFELRTRAEEMERKFFESKLQLKKFTENATKNIGELAKRISKPKPQDSKLINFEHEFVEDTALEGKTHIWDSLRSTPVGNVDPGMKKLTTTPTRGSSSENQMLDVPSKNNSGDIPDFHSMRLKIESLASERHFLSNENELLKRNIEQLTKAITDLERQVNVKDIKIRKLEAEIKQNQTVLKSINNRLTRAEKVAAVLEKQFKEAKPNTKIDYNLSADCVPSTQLLAALIPRDGTPNPEQPNNAKKM
ncbi:hypothetical protein HK098_001563 [Nowakowskiella sp. JEL0407]|nr:hypothetical protein HK098_001563 [Nowakowskiella sp. JEL0407]